MVAANEILFAMAGGIVGGLILVGILAAAFQFGIWMERRKQNRKY